MFNDAHVERIVPAAGRIDLKRGIEGLATFIYRNPIDGILFLFCDSKKDRIKVLFFKDEGFCLVYKWLSNGFFQRPRTY